MPFPRELTKEEAEFLAINFDVGGIPHILSREENLKSLTETDVYPIILKLKSLLGQFETVLAHYRQHYNIPKMEKIEK